MIQGLYPLSGFVMIWFVAMTTGAIVVIHRSVPHKQGQCILYYVAQKERKFILFLNAWIGAVTMTLLNLGGFKSWNLVLFHNIFS